MTPLARAVRRWWRSRGHGVHSPFAYRFITTVLRQRGAAAYYAWPRVEAMPSPEWHKPLFRLVCEFAPSRVDALRLADTEREAIALADSRVEVCADTPGIPFAGIRLTAPGVEVLVERNITGHDSRWAALLASMTSGMTFTDGLVGIAVIRHDLPRQDYEVNFLQL